MRAKIALFSPVLMTVCLIGCEKDDGETSVPSDTYTETACEDADSDGYCVEQGDCDDGNAEIHPNRVEECNGIDDNCNSVVDEGLADADGDGTCDERDTEECDGVDNDGDGEVDEGFDLNSNGTPDCEEDEVCDGVDNDGDGDIDEGYDNDGDGYTECGASGDGSDGDCDDAASDVNPGETEDTADAKDNDCDELIDESGWAEGSLVITEIMNNPSMVGDPEGEWFEVYNASGSAVYLNGLTLADSQGGMTTLESGSPVQLAAGEYAVAGPNADSATNGGVSVDITYSGLGLSNESDDLQIWVFDAVMGTVDEPLMIDQVSWDDGATFPDPEGSSMALQPGQEDIALNDDGVNWCATTSMWGAGTDMGSPGVANADCDTFDKDGDGFSAADGDCNDGDTSVYPGAPETDPTVDNDCDGDVEAGPTASGSEGSASNSEQCGLVYLDGSASSDPDGDTSLSYSWELVSAPSGSSLTSADISNADAVEASFVPDLDGVYTFSLTVTDSGGAMSEPATVDITVAARSSNSTPTADAGEGSSSTSYATCTPLDYGSSYECDACDDQTYTLDGTASADADGDSLTYKWSVASGSGSIADATAATAELLVGGPTPTYGGTEVNTVLVSLTVTDCMGAASDADTITYTYSCTGQ